MPYIVSNSDGTLTVTVQDNTIDTSSYSLALVGRHTSNFGQYFAQNTIRQLENFASVTAPAPSNTLEGQLWYDKGNQVLRVWDGQQWKRATNVVVGDTKPTDALAGGGSLFFDTKNNKLLVHNGNKFKDASYAGEVTSAYSEDNLVGNPTFYGARTRTIFLTDVNGVKHPVIAFSYVKSSASGINNGTTLVGEQRETIMALISDSEFVIRDTLDGGSASVIDGEPIDFTPELVGAGGIASARSGRIEGRILKGQNIRAEYEETGVASFETLFANVIGTPSDPVSTINVRELTVQDQLSINNSANVTNDLDVGGAVTIGGDLDVSTGAGTFANLTVTAGTILNGDTAINGNLSVNGVNMQSLGTDTEKVENIYGDAIDTQSIVVDGTATVNYLDVALLDVSGAVDLSSTLDVTGVTTLSTTNVGVLTASGAVDIQNTLNVDGVVTFASDLTMGTGATVTADEFIGPCTLVTVNANASENLDMFIPFVDGNSGTQELEADSSLRYNPNSNTLSTSIFDGNLTGDVTGNLTGDVTGTVSDISNHSTTDLSEGTNLYWTTARGTANFDANLAASDTGDLAEGTNLYFTAARARSAISAGGNLSYNSTTGVMSFTERTDAEVRNLLAGGTGVSYNNTTGQISIGQAVGTSSSVNFSTVTASTAVNVNGTVTATALNLGAAQITEAELERIDAVTAGSAVANKALVVDSNRDIDNLGTVTATNFDGVASSATYADLAEIYKADNTYTPGTVVKLGGSEEITQTTQEGDTDVFGVISTDPAYLMNSKAEGYPVAMTGRVPVRVVGKVKKGERLISSSEPGVAKGQGDAAYDPRRVIGRSLQNKTTDSIDIIEVVVGVK